MRLTTGKKDEMCDNASYKRASPIVSPQCLRNRGVVGLLITYHKYESDYLRLCRACAGIIARDARNHGYTVKEI